ncbi:MAG: hypothetical protein NVS9B15_22550 [Acidobacteriaceae bacterium]
MTYTSGHGYSSEIWLQTQDGTQRPLVTAADFPEGTTAALENSYLSPDGRRVVYARTGTDGSQKLWLSPIAGGTPIRLTDSTSGLETAEGWSPDGSRSAFGNFVNGAIELHFVSTRGNSTPAVVKRSVVFFGGWTPGGRSLRYGDTNAIWHLLSVDDKSDRVIGKLQTNDFVFSSDGKWLYGMRVQSGEYAITAYEAATGKSRTIRKLQQKEIGLMSFDTRLSLSPDGKSLAYGVQSSATNQIWMLQNVEPRSGWKWPWQ